LSLSPISSLRLAPRSRRKILRGARRRNRRLSFAAPRAQRKIRRNARRCTPR
jgi:hypothetical protein